MPEIAEVRLTSHFINKYSDKEFIKLGKSEVSKVKTDLTIPWKKFKVSSLSRGKEMVVKFHGSDESDNSVEKLQEVHSVVKELKLTLGMSGTWIYYHPDDKQMEKYHKHVHLFMETVDGYRLGMYDVRRFAKWSWGGFGDARSRGFDPIDEYDKFKKTVLDNWKTSKAFQCRLAEMMLNQSYFNGIGNYLRAEILYRLDISPFILARDLTEDQVIRLCELCRDCAVTAYRLGGGQLKDWKNPEETDATEFKDWVKCYGKMESIPDMNGRTFWFDKKWGE